VADDKVSIDYASLFTAAKSLARDIGGATRAYKLMIMSAGVPEASGVARLARTDIIEISNAWLRIEDVLNSNHDAMCMNSVCHEQSSELRAARRTAAREGVVEIVRTMEIVNDEIPESADEDVEVTIITMGDLMDGFED
jgi:hypothetical protein